MKKLTIKLKITLWFTSFMILLCAFVFLFITLVSNSTSTRDVRNALINLVDMNMREIEYDDGKLEVDDDFVSFRNGIYCLIFYENGEKVSGNAPYKELENESFEDMSIRQVKVDGDMYLIYDRLIEIKRHDDVWVRGVVLESGGAISVSAVSGAALIALPLLIILAAGGGYLIAGRSLRPIKKISETAKDVSDSGDLTKRIDLDSGGDELHQLAGIFNEMFDRLEQNFEAERHFTSDASHEMRTPVSTILAQCEYAFENASGEQELYEAIGVIQKQGYRMSHLIESLLYFTRIEQSIEEISFDRIDVSSLVLSVCREHKETGEKNISLTEDVKPGIEMMADTQLLARMIDNLIQNAYRYGHEYGNIAVSLKENDNEITLSVTDDGIGIAQDKLAKIWNRFYRADESRSSSRGIGLGLGLAMVKQIAELHGGRTHVESEAENGSKFIIHFTKSSS